MPEITDLDPLTTPVGDDLIDVVDVSDTAMSPEGSNKQVALSDLPVSDAQAAADATVQAAAEGYTDTQVAAETARAVAVEAAKADLVGGVVPDAQIPAAITRDSELSAAISTAINALLEGAPGALDTLNELAAAVNDDASFAASVTSALAGKQPLDADLTALAGLDSSTSGTVASDGAGWIKKTYAQFKTALGLVKADVGLGNVSNLSPAELAADPAFSGTYLARRNSVVMMLATSNLIMPHRGGYQNFPEDTMEAISGAIGLGFKAMKIDVSVLSDGALGVMHDTTTDRTTTSSGPVTNHFAASWRNLVIPAGTNFAPAWGNLAPPLLADVLTRYGDKAFFIIEPKTNPATLTPLINLIVAMGVQRNVAIVTTDTTGATIAACAAVGITCGYQWVAGDSIVTHPPATFVAQGAGFFQIDYSYSDADIAAVVAAGLPVIGFSVNRRFEAARLLSLGCRGVAANDAAYVSLSAAQATADRFALGTPAPGLLSSLAVTSTDVPKIVPFTGTPYRLSLPTSPATHGVLLGPLCPVGGASFTLNLTLTEDALDADTTKWFAIGVCAADDRYWDANARSTLYACLIRHNGQMQIFKHVQGATTNGVTAIGSASQLGTTTASTALTAGQSVPLKIQVTATQVTFTRTDTGAAVTVTDATLRGLYLHVGKNGAGHSASVSAVSVSVP